jgi:predicted ATP-dependent serine protease
MARIISTKTFKERKYAYFEFKDDWLLKIGNPEKGFSGLFFGPPKSGKSVELLKMCNYFAKNFGRVLYNSCEEKFSKTVQDNLNAFKIDAEKLFFADGLDYEELCDAVKGGRYKLVIVDSVQYMGLTYADYKAFRAKFPKVAIVLVNQINGKGQLFGGQQLLHAVDFYAKIENGKAEYRSRFLKDGYYEVQLFEPKGAKKIPKQATLF